MLENIDDTDPRDRTELVAAIDHPNLMVSLDTGHAELAHGRYGAPPVVDFIAASAQRLGHVHLQDADGYADRHWQPEAYWAEQDRLWRNPMRGTVTVSPVVPEYAVPERAPPELPPVAPSTDD